MLLEELTSIWKLSFHCLLINNELLSRTLYIRLFSSATLSIFRFSCKIVQLFFYSRLFTSFYFPFFFGFLFIFIFLFAEMGQWSSRSCMWTCFYRWRYWWLDTFSSISFKYSLVPWSSMNGGILLTICFGGVIYLWKFLEEESLLMLITRFDSKTRIIS